ncbi:hypothetical protein [Calycomorphotria hydatis]|uniref:Uncharacterized protein n=1 Tax=Calycomorphotria hydatis TaxID=2528027 RepID=A0A517TFA1_9PLAN|nr:hypothetical protein [Calycomorphotria hydatis]QDT67053.1 hypothetical protein V22_43250 [Calycomorphotria hydatis]
MLIDILAQGASPAIACKQIGVSFFVYLNTWCQDDAFRQKLDAIGAALSQNVAAALYRQAIEGSVSAQTFWLKNQPPPNWVQEMNEQQVNADAEEDGLENLSDEELRHLAEALAISIKTEDKSRAADQGDPPEGEPASKTE